MELTPHPVVDFSISSAEASSSTTRKVVIIRERLLVRTLLLNPKFRPVSSVQELLQHVCLRNVYFCRVYDWHVRK